MIAKIAGIAKNVCGSRLSISNSDNAGNPGDQP
jgi:hypothetical protein